MDFTDLIKLPIIGVVCWLALAVIVNCISAVIKKLVNFSLKMPNSNSIRKKDSPMPFFYPPKFDYQLLKSNLKIKWLRFYTIIRLPVNIVRILAYYIWFFTAANVYYYSNNLLITLTFMITVDIAFIVFLIIVYLEAKKLTEKGYKLNKFAIWAEVFSVSFNLAVQQSSIGLFLLAFFICFVFLALIWAWPNLVYFKKNKNYFCEY